MIYLKFRLEKQTDAKNKTQAVYNIPYRIFNGMFIVMGTPLTAWFRMLNFSNWGKIQLTIMDVFARILSVSVTGDQG